jgi:hypothetical protein
MNICKWVVAGLVGWVSRPVPRWLRHGLSLTKGCMNRRRIEIAAKNYEPRLVTRGTGQETHPTAATEVRS